jgi:DNA adenine methylase
MKKIKQVVPVVKWAGGKRQILNDILKYIPKDISAYYEPFVGGGAVLFELQPKRAVINDVNEELMNIYQVIKDNVDGLIQDLEKHENTETYFYRIREQDRNKEVYGSLTDIERASRIIYLNKTCYNGLFRVNKTGEFNVPFGNYKKPSIVNAKTLKAVGRYFNLAQVTFHCMDFEKMLTSAKIGSFVYLDPPYDPVSATASFTGYDKGGFDRSEQTRLKNTCDRLHKEGIPFLLSNSATEFIMDLYKEYKIEIIRAKRSINSKTDKRGKINEVLVRNFE